MTEKLQKYIDAQQELGTHNQMWPLYGAGIENLGKDGSTIDTGKAISALATNDGSVADYLEGVGCGWTISNPTLSFIAVPTTAGTGAEVTKNAVISSKENKFKKSIRSSLMIPNVALLDPELTVSLPAKQTAECGMDALTQLIESYVSKKSQPIPDALAIYGIGLAGKYLEHAVEVAKVDLAVIPEVDPFVDANIV